MPFDPITFDIETDIDWSEPKRLVARGVPKDMMEASEVPEAFWPVWRGNKDALKAQGISVYKGDDDEFHLRWWREVEGERQAAAETEALSRAHEPRADFEPPAPEGLAYLPYQKAGIAFALKVFGDI